MELGTLLNQNIKVVKEVEGHSTTIKFINTSNGMELANIWIDRADECNIWLNPGGVMNEAEYYELKLLKTSNEVYKYQNEKLITSGFYQKPEVRKLFNIE